MNKISVLLIFFIFSIFFSIAVSARNNYIVVYGDKFYLKLFDSNGTCLKCYPVGLGLNGMGKTREGDRKTPVGEYKIIWKASRFAQKDGGYLIRDGKAFCGPDNIFTTDPDKGYPDESLWTDGYGGERAVVMCLNYPNDSDRSKGYTGGCIEIHATLLGGIGEYSSAGCIRMYPDDARELYKLVDVGTKVFIKNLSEK
ncbi:MAG: L,D-transpeptidase [Candidatus Eremiobacterota bacterium]